MKRTIICFAKEPLAGNVKTRLSPSLSPENAAKCYESWLKVIAARLKPFNLQKIIAAPDENKPKLKAIFLGDDFVHANQEGNCLASRMQKSFSNSFASGRQQIVLIGSDSPNFPAPAIWQAFEKLASHDAVVGPAEDGGFWLIGLSKFHPECFRNVAMSSQQTCKQLLAQLKALNFSTSFVDTCYDIDNIADLTRLQKETAHLDDNNWDQLNTTLSKLLN